MKLVIGLTRNKGPDKRDGYFILKISADIQTDFLKMIHVHE